MAARTRLEQPVSESGQCGIVRMGSSDRFDRMQRFLVAAVKLFPQPGKLLADLRIHLGGRFPDDNRRRPAGQDDASHRPQDVGRVDNLSNVVADQRGALQIFVCTFESGSSVHGVPERRIADPALSAEISDDGVAMARQDFARDRDARSGCGRA